MVRLTALLAAIFVSLLVLAGPAAAASQTFTAPQTLAPACSGVNLRTSASPSASVKVKLGLANRVTVSGMVTGSSWGTSCPGWKAGSSWYTVTHLNGQAVANLFGVGTLYAATGVLTAPAGGTAATTVAAAAPAAPPTEPPAVAPSATPTAAPAAAPVAAPATDTSYVPACSAVNLRTSASTSATIKVRITPGSTVTAPATVSGPSWSTICPTSKSGSAWYVITQVNGQAVSNLYGVPFLFAATGVLVAQAAQAAPIAGPPTDPIPAAPAPATPAPAIAPIVTPETTPTPAVAPAAPAAPVAPVAAPATDTVRAAACSGVNLRTSASTSGTIKVKLALGSLVTVGGTVAGSSWSTSCPSTTAGSTWYVVTHVGGQSVTTLYGVPALYAASGVLALPVGAAPTAASLPVATVSTVASDPNALALGPATTFYGRGYGHGVGMSQYGARGRALAGQLAPEILAHYYVGTTIGSVAPDLAIRVLLLDNFAPTSTKPLTIYGRGGAWSIVDIGLEFPADSRLRLYPPAAPTESWRAVVDDAATQLLFDGPVTFDFRVRGSTDATTIQLFSKPTTYDLFRGTLRVLAAASTVDVVNELPLESYLRGVVPAEMPNSWPLEARIAQAIVARSYAAYQLRPTTGTFDVYDDTRSQVYLGVRQERPEADAVIATTVGQVLRSGASIVNALFHSTAGGATEHNENVFVSPSGARIAAPASYLRGSPDRDAAGVSYDAGAPSATWQTRAYTADELSAIFAKDARTSVGTLTGLDLRNRGVSGRLISVTLIGTAGTRTVSGTVFAAAFNAGKASTDASIRGTLLELVPIP